MKVAVSYQVLELAAISQVQICWELKLIITRMKENSFLTVEKLAFTISSRLNQHRLKGFSVKLRKAWTLWSILIGQLGTNQSQERARHLDGFIQIQHYSTIHGFQVQHWRKFIEGNQPVENKKVDFFLKTFLVKTE